ncbi:MAG: ABC transporter ATP-binding protein [Pseudomonadota bacterium]
MSTPRLSLKNVSKVFDGATVVEDLSLDVASGEVVCLLGPSGCGKSTTLRMAAGVERQTRGTIELDGRVVADGRSFAPPEARSIGLMFQDFALFPHLDIAANVAFGVTGDRAGKLAIAREYLAKVGLGGFEEKYPHMLSGGEQQRVALARALAAKPRVMLMDEPFSGLDNRLRDSVRDEALSLLKSEGAAVLLVTHDPEEAMKMADRIALMRSGRVVQIGAPYNIYNNPADRETAGFFSDVNVIHGRVVNRQMVTPFGLFLAPKLTDGADVEVIIRPEHLKVDIGENGPPAANPRTGIPAAGVVERSRFVGSESLIEVRLDFGGVTLTATVPGAFLPPAGTQVWLSLRRDHCHLFPCATQSLVSNPYVDETAAFPTAPRSGTQQLSGRTRR